MKNRYKKVVEESSRILASDKFKCSEDGFKHFIGYLRIDDVIRLLCIVLPPMSGYIKYFGNGRKNMSFLIEDESLYSKNTPKFGIKLKRC